MIPQRERITRRQYLSVCLIATLSPIIRQMPRISAQAAGSAGWLAPLASVPWLIVIELIILRLLKKRGEGEGMGEIFLRIWGKIPGRIILTAYGLWMLAYCGFVIRSGADRLLAIAYPRGGTLVFILVMGALGLMAALGSARTLARTANIFRPILIAAMLLVIFFALLRADLSTLLPVSRLDVKPVLTAGALVANVIFIIISFTFLENRVERDTTRERFKHMGGLLLITVGLVTALLAALLVTFGPEFTIKQAHPFFSMVRNLSLFGSLERIEALVIALWVLTDFVLISGLLLSGVTAFRLVIRRECPRLLPVLCTLLAVGFALVTARDTYDTTFLAHTVFPLTGAVITFGLFPLSWLVGLLRKRI